jgi:hypothetical protein
MEKEPDLANIINEETTSLKETLKKLSEIELSKCWQKASWLLALIEAEMKNRGDD